MAPLEQANRLESVIKKYDDFLTAYNKHLLAAEIQLTAPALARQKEVYLERARSMAIKLLGGENMPPTKA